MTRALLAVALLALPGCCTCPLEPEAWPTEEQHGQHAPATPSGPLTPAEGPARASDSRASSSPSSTARTAGAIAGGAATVATGNPLVGEVVGWATVSLLTLFGATRGRRRRPRVPTGRPAPR